MKKGGEKGIFFWVKMALAAWLIWLVLRFAFFLIFERKVLVVSPCEGVPDTLWVSSDLNLPDKKGFLEIRANFETVTDKWYCWEHGGGGGAKRLSLRQSYYLTKPFQTVAVPLILNRKTYCGYRMSISGIEVKNSALNWDCILTTPEYEATGSDLSLPQELLVQYYADDHKYPIGREVVGYSLSSGSKRNKVFIRFQEISRFSNDSIQH